MKTLALIPLLPLLGFLVNGLAGRRLPRSLVAAIACGLPAAAFLAALGLFAGYTPADPAIVANLWTWAATRGLAIDVALRFDALAAVMVLVITGIGTLIHVYSVGYMKDDPGFARYFAYLNLFLFFMLVLVLGANLPMMFVGWEGVGLASYLLIGFWFEDPAKAAAGIKAFVVNRVGDTGFLLAMFLIQSTAGTLDFVGVNAFFAATPPDAAIATAIGVLLLVGACGKSAQIPLHVWLPDAMAGPTPVSALIHAATMVTAGVYLLCRLNGLFVAAPGAMQVVAWVGALTAIVGATLGVAQYNLKKVLAYSTMSQIGLMVMGCGLGAFSAGMFHLYTHAFFKACLFLAAGAVLHALAGEEDMRRMGALGRRMPFTFGVFLVATLALCGLPPFAGFFSKDEILWAAWSAPSGSAILWAIGSATSFLTAFYMFRAVFMTFFGNDRTNGAHVHEPPPSMAVPLAVLAGGSIAAGFIGLPGPIREALHLGAPFHEFLARVLPSTPVREGIGHSAELAFMGIAVAVALAGIGLAWIRYGGRAAAPVGSPAALHRAATAGYYVDAFYEIAVVRPVAWLSTSVFGRRFETAFARLAYDWPLRAGQALAQRFARVQTGDLQAYVAYALVGVAAVLAWGAIHA